MNNLHVIVRKLGRILLYIAAKDIISVPILCSRREKCQGFLCGTLPPGGLSYLLYIKSHSLLHFDGIQGESF